MPRNTPTTLFVLGLLLGWRPRPERIGRTTRTACRAAQLMVLRNQPPSTLQGAQLSAERPKKRAGSGQPRRGDHDPSDPPSIAQVAHRKRLHPGVRSRSDGHCTRFLMLQPLYLPDDTEKSTGISSRFLLLLPRRGPWAAMGKTAQDQGLEIRG